MLSFIRVSLVMVFFPRNTTLTKTTITEAGGTESQEPEDELVPGNGNRLWRRALALVHYKSNSLGKVCNYGFHAKISKFQTHT